MKYITGISVFLLTYESLYWSFTLARHASWMDKHSALIHCKNLDCRKTMLVTIMAGSFSLLVGAYFIIYSIDSPLFYKDSMIACGIQLSHIHYAAVLARCTELPIELWPIWSRFMSKYFMGRAS